MLRRAAPSRPIAPRPTRRAMATAANAHTAQRGAIKIVIINGSVRPGNYTSMATALVADELKKDPRISVVTFNPGEMKLAMPGLAPTEDGKRMQQEVKEAAAVVLATPEYHGSYSSGS